jgi:Ca2+-binding EF-hand superfamily protein
VVEIEDYIKECASDKAFANIKRIENEAKALQRDVDSGGSGGITFEQLLGVVDHTEKERLIWIYIASLIEKDNKL